MLRLASELAGSSDAVHAARATARAAADVSGANLTAVFVEEEGALAWAATGGPGTLGPASVPALVERAARSRRLCHGEEAELEELDAASAVAVPCCAGDRLAGVLLAAFAAPEPVEVSLLETAAALTGSSLDNTRRLALSFAEARHDALTGLPNHRAFDEHLSALMRNALDQELEVALVLLDLDDFKRINDSRGHPVGNRVLRGVARTMLRPLRLGEEVFRVGGEEFALVLEGGPGVAKQVAERVREALMRSTRGFALPTVSAGVASFPQDALTKDELVHKADLALYAAKRAGKNTVVVYSADVRGAGGRTVSAVSRGQVHERMEHAAVRESVLAELAGLRAGAAALGSATSAGPLLKICARELTAMLGATACTISCLRGDLLITAAQHWPAPYDPLIESYAYLLSDYPATREVIETDEPHAVSLDDEAADASEAFVLREVKMQAVLMLPLRVGGRPWGLVEVYDARPRRFGEADTSLAQLVVGHAALLLEQFENRASLEQLYRETLASLSNALEAKDDETSDHTQAVAELALEIGSRVGLGGPELRLLELGALLHDIGKIRVPDTILTKRGPLTEAEWEIVRTHTIVGERILEPIASLRQVLPIVRSSHERWDGGGYPDGLVGDAIPLAARIVSVCDAYTAMVESRPYRDALDPEQALRELRRNAGTQFDPACVQALLDVLLERERAASDVVLHRPDRAAEATG